MDMPRGSDLQGVVVLRPVIDADLDEHFRQQADPESARMAAVAARDRPEFDRKWAELRADPATTLRTITLDDEVTGHLVGWEQSPGHHAIGYRIGRRYWGRGIATEALRQFLELVPHRPLWADVAAHNTGSVRVLEKCGFTQVGTEAVDDDLVGPIVMLRFEFAEADSAV